MNLTKYGLIFLIVGMILFATGFPISSQLFATNQNTLAGIAIYASLFGLILLIIGTLIIKLTRKKIVYVKMVE